MTEQEKNTIKLAEKVMDWKPIGDVSGVFPLSRQYGNLTVWYDAIHINQLEGWNPYEVLADAWMLIDKLRESRKWCCILLDSDYNYVWEVKLKSPDDKEGDHDKPTVQSGCCESICEAICIASLRTLL